MSTASRLPPGVRTGGRHRDVVRDEAMDRRLGDAMSHYFIANYLREHVK